MEIARSRAARQRLRLYAGLMLAVCLALGIAVPLNLGPVAAGLLSAAFAIPWVLYAVPRYARALRSEHREERG